VLRNVQVVPSVLVMTRFVVEPELAVTATNFLSPVGPPHVTDVQPVMPAGVVLLVQVMPSGLVITPSLPFAATATNFSCPVGPPHATDRQGLSAAEVRVVQVMPSASARGAEGANSVATIATTAIAIALTRRRAWDRTLTRSILRV
jgi:hypothetical protein